MQKERKKETCAFTITTIQKCLKHEQIVCLVSLTVRVISAQSISLGFQVTPMSDRDFGRYNCTARNNIGIRYQEFILAQAGESVSSSSTTRLMCFISAPLPM